MIKEKQIEELENSIKKVLKITKAIYLSANVDKDYSDLNFYNKDRHPSRGLIKFNNDIKKLRVSLIKAIARLEMIPIKIEQ